MFVVKPAVWVATYIVLFLGAAFLALSSAPMWIGVSGWCLPVIFSVMFDADGPIIARRRR